METGTETVEAPQEATTEATPQAATPAADWRDGLPDELKANPTISQAKSVADLAKMTVDTMAMVGADKVVVPGEKSTPEQWEQFYNKTGRPASPEDYMLKSQKVAADSEETLVPQESVDAFAKFMHAQGASTKAASATLAYYEQTMIEAKKASDDLIERQTNANIETLKKHFGNAYDDSIELARAAVREMGGSDLAKYYEESGFGNDPSNVIAWSRVGKMLGEHRILGKPAAEMKLTPEQGKAKREALMADKDFLKAWKDGDHPGHADAMAQLKKISDAIYANGPAKG